jgi:DNA-binding transcriptional ArsR family regulator
MGTANRDKQVESPTLGAVVAHPLRSQCLSFLAERTASPVEIAAELDENLGNVSYHIRKLWKAGVVEIVEEKPVRGAMEHFYRALKRPMFSDEEIADASIEDRRAFCQHIFSLVTADATRSLESRTFVERSDYHISRAPMRVDEDGWKDLRDLHEATLNRILEIQTEAAERLGGDPGFPVIAFNTCFEMPERPKTP